MEEELIVVVISTLIVVAGVAMMWMAMQSRRQIREMEHRERLAMIERGLAPAPEVDPATFERKLGGVRAPQSPNASRARSGGVMLVSFGLAVMFMLSFAAGEPGVGVGVGGAFALLGVGFFVNSMLLGRSQVYTPFVSAQVEPPRPRPTDTPQ